MEKTHRSTLKALFSIFFIFTLVFATAKPVHAGPIDWISKKVFGGVAQSFDLDIRRTITDTVVTALTELPNHVLFGRSSDEIQICSLIAAEEMTGSKFDLAESSDDSEDTITREDLENAKSECSDINFSLIAYDMGYPQQPPTSDRSGGGLATGLYRLVGGAVYIEDVPASLAYYSKSMARKIPIVQDTAFAASGPYDDDNPLWPAVLQIWEVSKNISYGLLALFMLYIGIMIMMRKETDPRTAVTVQSALPKIVIAVILITFSYAIGAFGAEALRALSKLAYTPIRISQEAGSAVSLLKAFMSVAALSVYRGGLVFGLLAAVMQVAILLTLIFLVILIAIKIFIAYFKIIIGIWIAPVTFAWGSIPGNEDSTINWFRNLAVNVISVPAMKLGVAVSLWVAIEMLANVELAGGSTLAVIGEVVGTSQSSFLAGLAIPMFLIVILFWTLKIPNLLEEAILNKKGNR